MDTHYSTKSKLVENLLMFDANLRDKRSSKEVSKTCSFALASNRFLCLVLIQIRAEKVFSQ